MHSDNAAAVDATTFWEDRYGDAGPIWSGRMNPALADALPRLGGGAGARALDLGCGEGGDAIGLASAGWQVTAVDISGRALVRASRAAVTAGVDERIAWVRADLSTWTTGASFDLVSACFLHSPVAFPRVEVLQRAASLVAPGGHLLVVGHAHMPPWADEHAHDVHLPSASEQVAELALDEASWDVLVAEDRPRLATGPDGSEVSIDDAVVLARRR
jgi:SAM-dependent methyltransferase